MADQDPQQPVVANDESSALVDRLARSYLEHFPEPVDYGEYDVFDYLDAVTSPFLGPIPLVFGTAGSAAQAHVVAGEHLAGLAKYFYEQYGGPDPKVDIKKIVDVNNLPVVIDEVNDVLGDVPVKMPMPVYDALRDVVTEIDESMRPTPEAPPEATLLKNAEEAVGRMTDEEWKAFKDKLGVRDTDGGSGSGSDDTNLNAVSPFDPTGAKGGARSGYGSGQGESASGGGSGSGSGGGSDSGGGSGSASGGGSGSSSGGGTSDDPPPGDPGSGEYDPGTDNGEGSSDTVGHSYGDDPSGSSGGSSGGGESSGSGSGDGGGSGGDGGSGDGGGSGSNADVDGEPESSTVSGQDENGNWAYRDENGNWTDENGNPLSEEDQAEWEQAYQDSKNNQSEGDGQGEGEGEGTPGVSTTPIDETPPVDPVLQEQLNAELQKLRDAQGARLGDNGATDPSEDSGFDVPSDVALSDLPTKVDWVGNPTGVETHNGPVPGGIPAPGYTSSHGTGVIHQDAPVQTTGPDERGQDVIPGGFGSGARGNGTPPDAAPNATLPPELRGVTVDDPLHGARPVATGTDHYYAVAPSGGTTGAGSSDASNSDTSFGTGSQDNTAATPSSSPVVDSPYDNVPEPLHEVQPGLARSGGMDIDGGQYQATPAGGATDYGDGNDAGGSDDTGASPFAPPVVDSPYDDVPEEVAYDPTS